MTPAARPAPTRASAKRREAYYEEDGAEFPETLSELMPEEELAEFEDWLHDETEMNNEQIIV